MKIFYEKMDGGNFGDDMNEWFWDSLLPNWRSSSSNTTIFGIGTILSQGNISKHKNIIVLGSGVGYGKFPKLSDDISVQWVRGPRTADALSLDRNFAITDPAILTPSIISSTNNDKRQRPIFIPHATTAKLDVDWESVCNSVGVEYVSPKNEAKYVIKKISQAECVIAESMHAAIIADAYRIPWTPVAISNQFNEFKWMDWCESLNLNFNHTDYLLAPKKIYMQLKRVHSIKNYLLKGGKTKSPSLKTDAIEFKNENDNIKKLIENYSYLFEVSISRGLKKSLKGEFFLSDNNVSLDKAGLINARLEYINSRILS